jgi:hypothetical protein
MSASAPFSDIQRMLEHCAKSSTIRLATHSRVIHYNGRVYRTLPKFSDIEFGHIRKMVRYLGIDQDCAARYLPNAYPSLP